jgi:hypothetical protein
MRRLVKLGLKGKKMTPATHRERQFMQHLHGAGWVKAVALRNSPKLVKSLLGKGWIERRQAEGGVSYRISDKGLAAKMTPVRI